MATEAIPPPQKPLPELPTNHHPDLDAGSYGLDVKRLGPARWPSPRPKTPLDIIQNRENIKARMPKRKLKIEDFELLKTLGTGTFARVWLVRLKNPKDSVNAIYALKVLRKADANAAVARHAVIELKQVEHVRNENNALHAVAGHPFITTLVASFSDEECLYMLLDYCPGGEIFSFLRRIRRFNEATARFYAAEIVLIIGYLHDVQGVAYRDLKPENILLDAEGHLKLVDFGFAKQLYGHETYTLCGTPEYLAPEVIHNSGHGLAVDWWALGILIYEFLAGQPPFWDPNPMRIYEQIVDGALRFPHHMSAAARDIIGALCKTSPSERLGHISGGTQRVKDHPFFRGINWDDLYYRRVKGPIVPRVDHPADAGNFEEYPPPPDPSTQSVYTGEMRRKYERLFNDFDDY
ncbi:cytochrome c oxidase subunit 1 [Ophidiomyces ophidiicola]|nr:cytochrome c oxidase subunit 1 [Ophidiomyces ophidiicola]KAI1964117.1 cytochrome c oxidase subunit 1 [Ophidiomyces ophidiicola]